MKIFHEYSYDYVSSFIVLLLTASYRYGIGVAAHRGGIPWSQFLATSIPYLFQATQIPDARSEDAVYATGQSIHLFTLLAMLADLLAAGEPHKTCWCSTKSIKQRTHAQLLRRSFTLTNRVSQIHRPSQHNGKDVANLYLERIWC